LDLRRLAVRIESAVNHRRQDWDQGDVMEFRGLARRMVSPADLRGWAKQWEIDAAAPAGIYAQYRGWLQMLVRMESLVNQNKPNSIRSRIRRMRKGRPTFGDI
jgi:hypothetical protein